MNITKEKENGILTVSIEGELNIKTAPGLSQEIEGELDDVNEVHFDLKETRYISSSGLRVLLKTFQILDKKNGRMSLNKGDILYLYTDGVTEAHNGEDELFGDKRLIRTLNKTEVLSAEEIDSNVRKGLKEFVGETEQYDDITTLCFIYRGI